MPPHKLKYIVHQDSWLSGGPAYKVFPLASPSSLGLINCLFVVNEQAFKYKKQKHNKLCTVRYSFIVLSWMRPSAILFLEDKLCEKWSTYL